MDPFRWIFPFKWHQSVAISDLLSIVQPRARSHCGTMTLFIYFFSFLTFPLVFLFCLMWQVYVSIVLNQHITLLEFSKQFNNLPAVAFHKKWEVIYIIQLTLIQNKKEKYTMRYAAFRCLSPVVPPYLRFSFPSFQLPMVNCGPNILSGKF